MLTNQLGAADNPMEINIYPDSEKTNYHSTEEMKASSRTDVNEQLGVLEKESSTDWRTQEDRSLSKSYLMFENNANLCWLDSSMSLLCHNKTLSYLVNNSSSQIANIKKGYESAISIFNDYSNENTIEERLQRAKLILQKVQGTVLEYLTPILKCKEGEPDSAFCSLLNLINEDSQITNLFLVEFSWIRNCTKCAIPRVKSIKKTIITLSKVMSFNPSSPVSLYKCPFCESLDQEMLIKYKTLPQCLIFHFENGAGEGELDSLDFELDDRKYKLSGLIKLEKSRDLTVSHFVTWVRDIATDSWLECNDLNSDILSFSVVPPLINLKDLYIVMYEALDDKGTISNVSEDIDNNFRMDTEDTNSSDILVIELDGEEGIEIKQDSQTDKGTSNTVFLGGLFKPDKTNYDSIEKMSTQLDEILPDNVFRAKSTLKSSEDNTVSKKEKISPENSELQNLDLQDNASSTSSVKSDEVPLQIDVFSKSVGSNSESDNKNVPGNSSVLNIKQSQVKNSIKMCLRDEKKPLISSNSEMSSFNKPVLDNTVKKSKINGKPLIGTSSNIEKMTVLINTKDAVSGKKLIPPILAENLLGKDHVIASNSSSRKNPSIAFETQDNKNSNFPTKNPIELQNSKLDVTVLAETNNVNRNRSNSPNKNPATSFENQENDMNRSCSKKSPIESQNSKLDRNISVETSYLSPINVTANVTQNSVEFCAGTSLSSSLKELKRKFKTDNLVSKKRKTVEKEIFTENAAADYIDNLLTVDDEKPIETSTHLDLALNTSTTQKQLQKSGIHLSTSPKNLTSITIKKTSDKCVLESKSVDTLVTEAQDINTRLPVESCILDRKVSDNSTCEIRKETESPASKQNQVSKLNPADEKSAQNLFESNTDININRNIVEKHADNSIKEAFVEADKNLTIDSTTKQSNVNAAPLESFAPKVSENKNSTSSLHQATILINTATKQLEDTLALSVKPNVKAVESREITENVSLKKTVKQHMREFEEKHTIFSENQVEVKNLPSKNLFVKLTRLKDCEIANYLSGNFNFQETKQIKSLEELTKTIVVKVEKTDSRSILKRTAHRAISSKVTKVKSIEPVRKSSRIFARNIRKAEKAKESLLEQVSMKRNNSHEQLMNGISAKSTIKRRHQTTPTEITEKALKTDLSTRSYRTHSATNVSSTTHLRRNAKKRDSNADESVKSKHKTNSINARNFDMQSHLPIQEPDVLLQFPSPQNENFPMPTNKNNPVPTNNGTAVNTGDHVQPYNGTFQLSSVHELEVRNMKENIDKYDKTDEYASDSDSDYLQEHEIVEHSSNVVCTDIFKFFYLQKKNSSY
ncbi:unnamed protein product [Larinioides sclopetarius]|uniref:USP domain-containing protein n=1 Tax=Larinioides sclopetarius TaxID=280406 RepID=A0AAV2A4Z1_9ARAC